MKRGALLLFVLILASFAYAQECDYEPKCLPNLRFCGCGGNQTRYTVCEGGCSAWYPCSVPDVESACLDGADNDCDGNIDCADPDCSAIVNCIDDDNDGAPLSVDCDDSDPNIYPGAPERCNNADDDCDSMVDESLDRSCGIDLGICHAGIETCSRGRWVGCSAVFPLEEICNTLDDDCDGQVDEGCSCVNGRTQQCGTDIGVCAFGSQSCIAGVWSACSGGVSPVAEVCANSVDDDCDGLIDEDCAAGPVSPPATTPAAPQPAAPQPSYMPATPVVAIRECIDADGDGYGTDCAKGFDCDDSDAAINPGTKEVCNDVDDDCNAIVDDQLSRRCGVSDIGVCEIGNERCIDGEWAACSAILPSEELCNNLDDNCDGRTDEGCVAVLSKEKSDLLSFLDMKFGTGNYSKSDYLDKYEATNRFLTIHKSAVVDAGKTRVTIEVTPIQGMRNLDVFLHIPKSIASSVDKVRFSTPPEVIQSDPLVAWHFVELTAKAELGYEVDGEFSDAADLTQTVAVAEETIPLSHPWYFDLIPLVLIPVLGFIFIFLVEMAHKKRK